MKKLKLLWFLLVPIAWLLSFKLVVWVQYYPLKNEAVGLGVFLFSTAFLGTISLIIGSIGLAINLQD